MTHFITRATPMHHMTARAKNQNYKALELFNQSYEVWIMPIVIYGLGGGHTHTHTHTHTYIRMKVISRNYVHTGHKWVWFMVVQNIQLYSFILPRR